MSRPSLPDAWSCCLAVVLAASVLLPWTAARVAALVVAGGMVWCRLASRERPRAVRSPCWKSRVSHRHVAECRSHCRGDSSSATWIEHCTCGAWRAVARRTASAFPGTFPGDWRDL